MKKRKGESGGVLLSLFELVVGVLLLIDPARFTSGILIAAGVIAIGMGLC